MKKLRWCIIICFTIFVSLTYSEQTSVLDKINQSASVEKKIIDQTSSSSLMDEAVALYRDGKYSESENVFEYILQQDPYNRKAMEYLQRIATRVSVISEVEQQSARAQALAKIGQSWKDSPKVYKIEIDDDVKPTTTDEDNSPKYNARSLVDAAGIFARSVSPGTNSNGALLFVRYRTADLTSLPPTEILVEGFKGP